MRIRKPKYLIEDIDRHGNVRVYFRRGDAPKIRIRDPFPTPAFWTAYQAALDGSKAPPGQPKPEKPGKPAARGSLLWLCRRYLAESDEYKKLDATGQKRRRSILERLCQEPTSDDDPTQIGTLPFATTPVSKVRKLRDRVADRSGYEAGNSMVKALRQVFVWAIADDVPGAERNPAREVPYLKGGGSGFHTWTVEEIEQYEKRHPIGTKARLAIAILKNIGTRRSDIVSLGKQHIRRNDQVDQELRELHEGRFLQFNVFKGRKKDPKTLLVPILPELENVLAKSPLGSLTFLETAFKKPFTANGFGNKMRDWCDEADLPHCSAHGLRKAAATQAAENGATEYQLMAIFGWSSPKQAAIYTRKARQSKLAAAGMKHLKRG
ncbi:MAG: tyrosine-type recombinase/integrase [Xanthobacteraceae bacterium]